MLEVHVERSLRVRVPPRAPLIVGYSSGQRGQTVNLLAHAFGGSNPPPTTIPMMKPPLGGFKCLLLRQSSVVRRKDLKDQKSFRSLRSFRRRSSHPVCVPAFSPHLPERARFHVGMFRREIAHSVEGLMHEIHFFIRLVIRFCFCFFVSYGINTMERLYYAVKSHSRT